MKKLFLLSIALGACLLSNAQTSKSYRLTVVAEGNFGTPNGDIFRVEKYNENPDVLGPLYQNANSLSQGIDVLQDFDYWETKAVLCGKGSHPTKLAVVNYPNMDTVFTVNAGLGAGLQRCGMVSDNKAYIVGPNSNAVKYVDINTQTIGNVTDSGAYLSSGIHSMIGYNANMYVANGTKVVLIDTINNATTGTIVTGLTGINTMVKDTANSCLWLLGKVGTVNAIAKIDVNTNTISTPIMLTGFTNAKLLRVGPNKLYFVSGTGFYVYDLATQTVPTSPVYTSSFTGFAVMYDRAFTVDPISGDFAYTTAGLYVAPGLYEIIDGTTYARIDSGAVTNAAIPNELFLSTWTNPVSWDTASLPDLYASCSHTLVAPNAYYDIYTIPGTTSQTTFNAQGNYTIEWQYVYGNDTITQLQQLTIADTTAPVADSTQLSALTVQCPYTLIPPTATDDCYGPIEGTTDSLTFTTAGVYGITWTYTDSLGNTSTQQQTLEVICDELGIAKHKTLQASVYPNPAKSALNIELQKANTYQFTLTNTFGQIVLQKQLMGSNFYIDISNIANGLYLLQIKDEQGNKASHKVLVQE